MRVRVAACAAIRLLGSLEEGPGGVAGGVSGRQGCTTNIYSLVTVSLAMHENVCEHRC